MAEHELFKRDTIGGTLDERIAAKPAPKVTIEDIKAVVTHTNYIVPLGTTLTICILTLRNGFTVTGESACASPENFDKAIGEELAYKAAVNKVWTLEAYLLREDMYANEDTSYEPLYADRVAEWQSHATTNEAE